MPEEVLVIVKIPLSEIAESVKSKHTLPSKLTEARIEGDDLILSFAEETMDIEESPIILSSVQNSHRKRRARRKRNRMKTRGWKPVERIVNSKGQKCTIYKPFVDALQNQQLTPEEQRKKVGSILRANRNRPSEESIEYFLNNTLEYLKEAQ